MRAITRRGRAYRDRAVRDRVARLGRVPSASCGRWWLPHTVRDSPPGPVR